jgi:fucose permease
LRQSFGLPLDFLGVLLGCATVGYLASSFVSGPLTRRFGVGGVLVGSSALVTASAFGFAAATSLLPLLAAAVFSGLGGGAIDACINGFAATRFPAGRVVWLHASYGVGAMLGPSIMTAVLTAGVSWRVGYLVVGVAVAALGIAFLRTRDLWRMEVDRAGAGPHARLRESARRPVVLASSLLFLVYTGVEAIPGAWVFSLLTEARGVPTGLAGTAVTLYWGGLTFGRLVAGAVPQRVPAILQLRLCLLLIPAWSGLLWADLGNAVDLLAIACLGFTLGPVFPLLISATPGRVGAAHSANAVGVQISLASLGWAVLPGAAGVLADRLGLEAIPPFLLACALVVVLLHEGLVAFSALPARLPAPSAPIEP